MGASSVAGEVKTARLTTVIRFLDHKNVKQRSSTLPTLQFPRHNVKRPSLASPETKVCCGKWQRLLRRRLNLKRLRALRARALRARMKGEDNVRRSGESITRVMSASTHIGSKVVE